MSVQELKINKNAISEKKKRVLKIEDRKREIKYFLVSGEITHKQKKELKKEFKAINKERALLIKQISAAEGKWSFIEKFKGHKKQYSDK